MSRRRTTGLARLALAAVVALALTACTRHRASPSPSSTAPTGLATLPTVEREVHPTRVALAFALPSAADLPWLPLGSLASVSTDVADRLVFVGCSAAPHEVASDRANVADVVFHDTDRSGRPLAEITYHDVVSVDDAAQFMAGTRAFLRCPNQGASGSTTLLPLGAPTGCDDTVALRTTQPVGATIDAWCRVGNLVGRIHLDPRGGVEPTIAQGVATIDAVGARLGSLFA